MLKKSILALTILSMAACAGEQTKAPQNETAVEENREVNIYTKRHYESDKILFDKFTEKTGIAVNLIPMESSGTLIERMAQEGANSPCDVFITSDAGNLGLAASKGLLQPVKSDVLKNAIPPAYRDPNDLWFGLSVRARIIAYNKANVAEPSVVTDYSDLAKEEYKGKVLVRSSSNIYNQSLLAAMIANKGAEASKTWAQGIVANMARDPKGGDTDQLKGVAAGHADFAIANSYYLARLISSDDTEKQAIGAKLGVIFPKMGSKGTHVNISGAGLAANAPNPDEALALLEFLISDEAQAVFAEANNEYPVRSNVALSPVLQNWGTFVRDDLNLSALFENNAEAARIFDEVNWK